MEALLKTRDTLHVKRVDDKKRKLRRIADDIRGKAQQNSQVCVGTYDGFVTRNHQGHAAGFVCASSGNIGAGCKMYQFQVHGFTMVDSMQALLFPCCIARY